MATLTKLPRPLRQKLRDKAIDKVRQDIIHAGRHESDYSDADLAFLIGEKEKESEKRTALPAAPVYADDTTDHEFARARLQNER